MEGDEPKLRLVSSQAAPSRLPRIQELAEDILRDLVKATVTQTHDAAVARALRNILSLRDEVEQTDENIRYWDVLMGAVEGMCPPPPAPPYDEVELSLNYVIRTSVGVFTELTAKDNARNGRLSSKRHALANAIRCYNDAIEEKRRDAHKGDRSLSKSRPRKRRKTKIDL